jgi:hypothetical protein
MGEAMDGHEWLATNRVAIEQLITNETEQARLAQRLIPEVSVPEQTRFVSVDRFDYATGTVDEQNRVDIERFEENVNIPKLQTDDPDPSRALIAVRRAAQRLTRQHDQRVFRDAIAVQIETQQGQPGIHPIIPVDPVNGSIGEGMIPAVAAGIALLDDQGYRTGYAIVASNTIWTELHRRGDGSFTIPIEPVKALIDDGPVHRSAVLTDGAALLLALGEGRFDRVVAESPRLAFVDQGIDLRSFDLFERFVPRFRETFSAVELSASALSPPSPP